MTARDARQALHRLTQSQIETNVVLVAEGLAHGYDFRRLNLSHAVARHFAALSRTTAEEWLAFQLRQYAATYKPDRDELVWLRGPNALRAPLAPLFQSVGSLPLFDGDETFVKRIRFYAIVLTAQDQASALFRGVRKAFEIHRKGLFVLLQDGQYNHVESPGFVFDDTIDCALSGEYFLIGSKPQFERIFRYFERLRESATETLDALLEQIPIQNEDEFRDAVLGQMQMLAKLASISEKAYLDDLTAADLAATIDRFGLDVEVSDEGELVFDPAPSRRWEILKLLDDDYLTSEMTDNLYEANSKSQRE